MSKFDVDLFRSWQTETDPIKKKRIQDKLLTDNLPLAKKFAARAARQMGTVMEMEDVLQAAYEGLIKTLEGYKPEKAAFSTYAAFWIKAKIQDLAKTCDTIKRPRDVGMPYPVFVVAERIRLQTGREATPEELTAQNAKGIKVTQADLDSWDLAPVVFQLDASFDPGGEGEQECNSHEALSEDAPGALDIMVDEARLEELREAMLLLSDREQEVIEALFFEDVPYADLAKRLGISEEIVRRTRASALDKLRASLAECDE